MANQPRVGHPSAIDVIVGQDDDGNPITVAERIVEAIRVGSYIEPAAKRAGVPKQTVYEWLHVAGKLRLAARGQPIPAQYLTEHELACLRLADAVDRAESEFEIGALGLLQRLARGGIEVKTTTTKTFADGSSETTTKIEHTLPNIAALTWRLARRFPDRYHAHLQVSGEVEVTLTDDERTAELVDTLDAYLQGVADAETPTKQAPKPSARRGPSPNGAHTNGDAPS